MGLTSQYEKDRKAAYNGPTYAGKSGVALNRLLGIAAGSGFLLFGYDQGVMGGLLSLPAFVTQFPEIDTTSRDAQLRGATSSESTLQGLTIGLYEIGCLLGALSCLWLGDMLGRRKIIWIGTVWMAIGAIIQAASAGPNAIVVLIMGRIIGGVGNGMHTATIPMYASETSPPHKRGSLIMVEGLLITGGIFMAYVLDLAFFFLDPNAVGGNPDANPATASVSWRFPIAFQLVLCIPTLLVIWMPESPRWLMLKGNETEARNVMAALDEMAVDDPEIDVKIKEIRDAIEMSKDVGVADLFRQGPERNFHRTVLGFVIQMFQQISGINLITYYAAFIFENNIGLSPLLSRILALANGCEYFLASFIAVFIIEKYGRRNLMLYTAALMSLTMAALTATTHPNVTRPRLADPNDPLSIEATNKAPGYAAAVLLFLFNTWFAIGWLGMTWLYPAEITPLRIRAAANGVSTMANWAFNFLVVLITPIAFDSIGSWTYTIFAATNLCILVTTYLIFPETAGRSLEEMDAIFARSNPLNPYDVVKIERETPRRYDKAGRPIAIDAILTEEGKEEKNSDTQHMTREASASP